MDWRWRKERLGWPHCLAFGLEAGKTVRLPTSPALLPAVAGEVVTGRSWVISSHSIPLSWAARKAPHDISSCIPRKAALYMPWCSSQASLLGHMVVNRINYNFFEGAANQGQRNSLIPMTSKLVWNSKPIVSSR